MTIRTDRAIVDPTPVGGARELRDRLRPVVEAEVEPAAAEHDRRASWPEGPFRAVAGAGVLALAVPREYGGLGASAAELCVGVEEIAWGCCATAACVQANWMAAWILSVGGSEEQKRRYLPPLAEGRRQGSFAVTEALGRHVARGHTTARPAPRGEGWRVNGYKAFVGNGGVADFTVFTASTTVAGHGEPVPCAFVADRDQPGFTVARVVPKLSIRGYQTADFEFHDLHVDTDRLVGEVGGGMRLAMATIDLGRVVYAAQCTGLAQRAVDAMAGYANLGRDQGRHLAQYQGIQFLVAEAAMATATARVLLYRAAAEIDGSPSGASVALAATAKQQAAMAAKLAADHALQVHGAFGLTEECVTERLYRDQRVTEIGVGTNEAMKTVVGRQVLRAAEGTEQG